MKKRNLLINLILLTASTMTLGFIAWLLESIYLIKLVLKAWGYFNLL